MKKAQPQSWSYFTLELKSYNPNAESVCHRYNKKSCLLYWIRHFCLTSPSEKTAFRFMILSFVRKIAVRCKIPPLMIFFISFFRDSKHKWQGCYSPHLLNQQLHAIVHIICTSTLFCLLIIFIRSTPQVISSPNTAAM